MHINLSLNGKCRHNASRLFFAERVNTGFEEYKGAFTEAYVLSEILASGVSQAFYFSDSAGSTEIDFIVQTDSGIMPIEVKAAENLRSKSLRTFIAAHENLSGVRFSLSPYREQDWMRNIPLYAVGAFFGIRHPYTLA